jgi:hypothetical protein
MIISKDNQGNWTPTAGDNNVRARIVALVSW